VTDSGRSILACGYIAMDVVMFESFVRQRSGGSAANVAANLRYLGWTSSLLGRLGADAPGRRILGDLKNSGVDVGHIELSSEIETPVVIHAVDPPSHRFSFSCPECGRSFPRHRPMSTEMCEEVLGKVQADPPHVFFLDRASAPAIRIAGALKKQGVQIVFEPSSRGVRQRTVEAAEIATILKCNSDDLDVGRRRALFQERPEQVQIESCGSNGLRARRGGGRWTTYRARRVPVIDSAGAGDWLTAALLSELAPGAGLPSHKELAAALDRAQDIAALNCCYIGARTLSEVDRATLTVQLELIARDKQPDPSKKMWGRRSQVRGVCRTCLGPAVRP
jgi:fructokinase